MFRVQVRQNLPDVLIAQVRLDHEAAIDDFLEIDRKVRAELLGGLRPPLDPHHHDLEGRGAAEGDGPGGHLVEDHAEREDVGLRADRLALDLLRRHVERRPDDGAGLRHARLLGGLGHAEVGDVDPIRGVEHDVLRLQVAMDDALIVGGLEALGGLAEDPQQSLDRELALLLQDRREVPSVDELHRQELDAVALSEVEDAQHVRVGDAAGELDLALEALEGVGVVGDVRTNQLESDVAVEPLVMDQVDRTHASHAQQALDPVPVADLETGRQDDGGDAALRLVGPLPERRRPSHRRKRRQLAGVGLFGQGKSFEGEAAVETVLPRLRIGGLALGADHEAARPT